jgi:uncharacterized delta-60 repeat protein
MSTKSYELKSTTTLLSRRKTCLQALLKIAGVPALSLILAVDVSAQCAVDGFNPNANNFIVRAIVIQPDGKILVGGDFTTLSPNGGAAVTRNHIARLNPDGTLDPGFNPNADGVVYSIALQADGRILVGGEFSIIGGQSRNRMARLDAATGAVDSFDPNVSGSNSVGGIGVVSAISVQADGKIIAGGDFTSIGGQPRNSIARLDATSGLADSFNPNAGPQVLAIALQADGKIVVGGFFGSIGGQPRHYIARLDPATGAADPSFPEANEVVYALALQVDGKILVGGRFNLIGGQVRSRLARLDGTTGVPDSFSTSANMWVTTIAVQADGKVLVGGLFHNIGGQTRDGFARLNGTTGATDASFNAYLIGGFVYAIAIQPDGKVWVGGSFASISRRPRNRIAKLDPDCIPGILGNISTRLRVLSGDNALIGGMIATGNSTKYVIVRALGPVLADFGVPGALADPTLELFQGNTLVASNDNWRESADQALIEAFGLAPTKDAESAIFTYLTPYQGYTAIVRGKNGATGVGVVEVYDIDQGSPANLANISTRGFVDVDDNVMIAGLIVSPSNGSSTKVLVRALGPTLGELGVVGALANPTLDLVNSSGTVIRSNDNWKDDPQQRALIEAAGLAPSHDEEAALVETVAPGAYTAMVRGNNGGTGVGLVEVYNIP